MEGPAQWLEGMDSGREFQRSKTPRERAHHDKLALDSHCFTHCFCAEYPVSGVRDGRVVDEQPLSSEFFVSGTACHGSVDPAQHRRRRILRSDKKECAVSGFSRALFLFVFSYNRSSC